MLSLIKERLETFQIGVEAKFETLRLETKERTSEVKNDFCTLKNRVSDLEKEDIRRQGRCDACEQSIDTLSTKLDEKAMSANVAVDKYKEGRWRDMGIAVTVTGIVVGLLTFIIDHLLHP